MSYCHNCDCAKLEAAGVTLNDGVLTVNIVPKQTYSNRKPYLLVIGCVFPAYTGTEPVAVYDGTEMLPLLDTNAQPVISGQLRPKRAYSVCYGAGGTIADGTIPPHLTVRRGLGCVEYSSEPVLRV